MRPKYQCLLKFLALGRENNLFGALLLQPPWHRNVPTFARHGKTRAGRSYIITTRGILLAAYRSIVLRSPAPAARSLGITRFRQNLWRGNHHKC